MIFFFLVAQLQHDASPVIDRSLFKAGSHGNVVSLFFFFFKERF